MQNDKKNEKKIPVQNKPQSSFMLRFVKCPYTEDKRKTQNAYKQLERRILSRSGFGATRL